MLPFRRFRTFAHKFLKVLFFDLYSKRHMTSRFLVDTTGVSTSTDLALASKVKQCYNNITVNTNNITLENTDSGVSKTVAVSGGSSASTIAFNSVSVSGNDLVFGKTDGNTDSEPMDGLTVITGRYESIRSIPVCSRLH